MLKSPFMCKCEQEVQLQELVVIRVLTRVDIHRIDNAHHIQSDEYYTYLI